MDVVVSESPRLLYKMAILVGHGPPGLDNISIKRTLEFRISLIRL